MKQINVLFTGKEHREMKRETMLHPPEGIKFIPQQAIKKMKEDYQLSAGKDNRTIFEKIKDVLKYNHYMIKQNLKNIDLIYSPGKIILNKFPWVVEIENVAILAYYKSNWLKFFKPIIKRKLKSKYCKAIICMSEAAKKSVVNYFDDKEIKRKCHVVYPYVKISRNRKYNKEKVEFLVCNTKFHMKGTKWVLQAFDELSQIYPNICITVISNTPKKYIEKYKEKTKIKFIPAKLSKDELYEKYYYIHDVFVQPTLQDSFGLVYLEAISAGMAVITTNLFAIPEMIHDNKNGFLLKAPFYYFNEDFTLKNGFWPINLKGKTSEGWYESIKDINMKNKLKEKMLKFIKNPQLIEEMGMYSQRLIKEGRFNEDKRKANLKKIIMNSI